MSVTEQEVRLGYLYLLNREPESEWAVQQKVEAFASASLEDLRSAFINSSEYKTSNPSITDEINKSYMSPGREIEVNVSQELLDKLVERVKCQWRKLGDEDPYWSVLTHENYRAENIDLSALEDFYRSGQSNADLIDVFSARSSVSLRKDTCFELGCGVGRITRYLAQKFDRVIAADISPGNLRICSEYMRANGITNVETMLIESPEQLKYIDEFGFFYSVIVLQHNSPPVQKLFLDIIFPKILPGGGCLFQTPDEFQDYSFNAQHFLDLGEAAIDTHCLPKTTVLKLIQDHGLLVRDVAPDLWLGPALGSYTYFATR